MEPTRPMLFFSYARADSEFALRLAKDLRSAGASIWLDQLALSPGVPWDDAIQNALRACPVLLIILSPTSVTSRNVMDEVSFALQNGKEVVPIMHRRCDIPFRLGRLNYIDFSADYNAGFEQLRKAMVLQSFHAPESGQESTINLQSTRTYLTNHKAVPVVVTISLFIFIALVYHNVHSSSKSIKHKITRTSTEYEPRTTSGSNAKVPNTTISGAILITEGETTNGSILTSDERHFFKFIASGRKTRVILRKGFAASLKILDRDEADISNRLAFGDDAVTLAFDSTPNALYYVEVSSLVQQIGDFELIVREE